MAEKGKSPENIVRKIKERTIRLRRKMNGSTIKRIGSQVPVSAH